MVVFPVPELTPAMSNLFVIEFFRAEGVSV